MDNYLLPATTYVPPTRQARKQKLNTIIEDERSEDGANGSEEEMESLGRGRPRLPIAPRSAQSTSPVPSLTSSISSYSMNNRLSRDFDDLYDVSDAESMHENDVATSSRSVSPESLPGSKEVRVRCPSLIIPSPGYWPTIQKMQNLKPALPPKIPISPAALSLLARDLPSMSHPPSLDGSWTSDPLARSTAPPTPNLEVDPNSEDMWGETNVKTKSSVDRETVFFDIDGSPDLAMRMDDVDQWYNGAGLDVGETTIVRDFACDAKYAMLDSPVPDSPVLGTEDGFSETGVQLPSEALATLQHLSLEIPFKADLAPDKATAEEMTEVLFQPSRPHSVDMTPLSQISEYSISRLSIPSPGGFFASLDVNARSTWCGGGSAPASAAPPSSTTAEHFYNCPWNKEPAATIESIIEVDDTDTDGPPTARQMPFRTETQEQPQTVAEELQHTPLITSQQDFDEDYEHRIQEVAEQSLDRTSVWLAAQTSYMSALKETNPVNDVSINAVGVARRASQHIRKDSLGTPMKKAVRFLESETAHRDLKSTGKPGESDSVYYHAFQHIANDTKRADAFRHRNERSNSIQSSRLCLPNEHLDRLQGNYNMTETDRPSRPRPISMFPGKETDTNEQTAEQKVIARVERERQALEQVSASMWVVEASKMLSGGGLLNSPAVNTLNQASTSKTETAGIPNCLRILDLGGRPNGDWAWHCAREFPSAKVYTATTEVHLVNSGIRGPRNHRKAAVSKLWELPFPDHHFDAISARTLFRYLKHEKPLGESIDEYDLCLRECLRCLKPGGYLEFFLLDSEIVNSGSRGTAVSVEFGFNLRTRGYDPLPTKSWLGRVRRAGFDDIKRAWTFLPMGSPVKENFVLPETPPPNVSTYQDKAEAVQGPVGSTADAANVSGLVGSWAWEQWMLKLQMEMGKERLLEGVGAVLEEGKTTGAGWRCLSGWARKPVGGA